MSPALWLQSISIYIDSRTIFGEAFMLVFVTSVKHPDNSQSYDQVWRLLNKTLFSVCSQQDLNFRVIVVCDKQLPLFHHEELIHKYTEFVEVDFSAHGQEVIDQFNRLGNLSPPLEDRKWQGIRNDYQTALELEGGSHRSRLIRFLERVVGKRGINNLRDVRFRIRTLLNEEVRLKLTRDQFHINNVVLNMGSKLIIGILAAKKYNPDYVMFVDADDYVGCDISAYVNSHPGENGWIMAHGYKMSGIDIVPFYRWNSICGTGSIFNHGLLMEFIGSEVTEKSTQNELFEHIDSEFIITIGRHDKPRSYFEERGRPLIEFPTRSVVHMVGHNESSEYTRRIIRGESVDHILLNARKFGEITPIYSTLIGYFNILPENSTKVFCLGFQKTGTTSVDFVLQDMGYQVAKAYKQPDIEFCKMLENGDLSELKQRSELFDAFQDIPWFRYYRAFDQWYPGSKFILTIRDSRSWWKSFSHYFRTERYPLFKLIYGADNPTGHEEYLVEQFERHNRAVIEYFKDRPGDLLVVDVSEEDALQKISDFLGKSTSYLKMPHKNATLRAPVDNEKTDLKKQLKKILKVRIISVLKIFTFTKPPIILGGCRKSGVEFLSSLLSCHPNIHVIGHIKLNYPAQHPLSPDRTVKPNDINPKTPPVHLIRLILKLIRKPIALSARCWCGASPLSVLVYDRLLEQYGKRVRILNVIRDGRDVVSENEKKVMARYAVDGDVWVHDVRAGMKFENHPQVLTIRYEDLIQDYERTINRICDFIGEKDRAPLLKYPKGATIITDQYWIGKWRQHQFAGRVEALLQTPDALECLQHYEYE
jgi:hypothetical protein